MDFITWWFSEHYIWSTILTPYITIFYSIYAGEVVRGILATILSIVYGILISGD